MKWFYLCVIQLKLYAIIPIIITADTIINNFFTGFFSREILSSTVFLISSVSVLGEINSENFPKKISAIFFAVISIKRDPTWAIFPPTFASTT